MKRSFKLFTVIIGSVIWIYSCSGSKEIASIERFKSGESIVRVRIINTLDTIKIYFQDEWIAYEPDKRELKFNINDSLLVLMDENKLLIKINNEPEFIKMDSLILKSKIENGQLEIKNVPFGIGWWWEGKEDRVYEGAVSIFIGSNKNPEVIVSLPLEKYLYGVVPYEIGGDSPMEALKAQAVAARSEAVMALESGMFSGIHYDLTSDVECQVFSGNIKRTTNSDKAVDETRGKILTENGKPINAYYASNCGGHSELIKNVWPDRQGFKTYTHAFVDNEEKPELDLSNDQKLREWIFSSPDVYCNPDAGNELPSWSKNNFRWKKEFEIQALSPMISEGKDWGDLLEIKVLKRGMSGRIYSAKFIFEKNSLEVNGELAIRMLWKPSLRSSCFVVDKEANKFILTGAGWGHGVGMCQSGAVSLAKQNKDFIHILNHYYQKAELKTIY